MNDALREWSHGAYGLLQSVWLARQNKLGNVGHLQDNIMSLCADVPSRLGFESSVPLHDMKPGDIHLDNEDEGRVVEIATRAAINSLLIALIVLFDELAADLAEGRVDIGDMPGKKATWLRERLDASKMWAAQGVTELVAIRNALVHGQGKWTERSVAMLQSAGIEHLPQAGDTLSPGVDDLFRYRRAVRTVLNELQKLTSVSQ